MIIRDIHKNSLCTQSSIGRLWTGLNHPIAHNPYSLSRVSVPKPRGPTSAPPPQPAGCQLSGGTLLHSLQYHRTKPGKIVEARLRFGTAEVSGFSRPSHFRPSGKSRRFFVHRPMPPILILPQLPQPPSSISTGNNVSLVCSPCLKALTLPLPVAFHCLCCGFILSWIAKSHNVWQMADKSATLISLQLTLAQTKDCPLVSCAILHADLRLSVESAERLYISADPLILLTLAIIQRAANKTEHCTVRAITNNQSSFCSSRTHHTKPETKHTSAHGSPVFVLGVKDICSAFTVYSKK